MRGNRLLPLPVPGYPEGGRALADAARTFLTAECPPSRVRAAWADGAALDRRLWSQLAEVGFLGVAVPEEFGGLGHGDLELAVLLEEAGPAQ